MFIKFLIEIAEANSRKDLRDIIHRKDGIAEMHKKGNIRNNEYRILLLLVEKLCKLMIFRDILTKTRRKPK